jgi:cytochrome c oxidase subunit 3
MTTTDLSLVDSRAADDQQDHPESLAHHFHTMRQQYEASKLGMWLFLATEVLLFGGLFCAYAVYRGSHSDVFAWGSQFLDVRLGTINTVVLILSSVSMAIAVTAVQRGRRWPVIVALGITFLCGVIFMAIKSVEYQHKFHENLVWGMGFYEPVPGAEDDTGTALAAGPIVGDPVKGQQRWNATCRSCHGLAGEGIAGQGKDIRTSDFIYDRDDAGLVAFVKVGRRPDDPLNTTGIQMPPRGGNPMLKDPDLYNIIAYLRTFMVPDEDEDRVAAEPEGAAARDDAPQDDAPQDAAPEPAVAAVADPAPLEGEFWIPKSSIPDPPAGPPGVDRVYLDNYVGRFGENRTGPAEAVVDPAEDRPANAHVFFGLYFLMTGLHAFHVLVGLGVIAWLILRTVFGEFGSGYFTPIDLGGLYWHIVDFIWIFLFPLFYLI